MKIGFFRANFFAISLALLLTIHPALRAQSAQEASSQQTRKLPPVNWIRSRSIDVKHVSIDLRFDWEKEQAFGSTAVTLAPFKATDKIALDAAMMQINSVALANGTALKFNYTGGDANDNLEITLDRVYQRGEDLTVKVEYRTSYVNTADTDTAIGSFGRGLRFIKPTVDEPDKPRQIWSQGETEFNRYWFPSYDSPNDFRTSELRATVEKNFTVVSNGKLVETKDNADGTRTFYWKMETPYTNYLTSIVVGEYRAVEQNFDGLPVVNYGYPTEATEVAATVKNLPDMIRFFSEKTGVRYPYPKYAQTFVEDFGGGMENISATTMIEEMIHDERELLDEDSDSLQAHELAHQWFGDLVTCREWGQIWLNESFATYFDALYHEHRKGHDDFLFNNVRANQEQYFETWNEGNRRPIVTKYYANKDAMFDNYAYPRGAAVLHMLRKHLGDENWWRAINHYLKTNMHEPVSTEDLRIAIEETTGESMDWFFDQWLYRMGHPEFEVTQNYDEAKKQLTLSVRQTQSLDLRNEFPQVRFFQTFVDVEIDNRVERVWIKPQAENVFTFEATARPKIVNFDYQGTLIKQLKFDKSLDDLLYQMANDGDILGRHWAMGEIAGKIENPEAKAKVQAALLVSAEKDASWRIRREALQALTRLIIPPNTSDDDSPAVTLDNSTVQVLLKAAKDENSLIRAQAISLLGTTQDAKYADLYLAALNDRSYSVIDQAAEALAQTDSPKTYNALVKLTNSPSWRGRLAIAGLNGLATLEDARAFELAYKFATDKKQPFSARTAALTVVGITGKGNPKAFPLIFDQFKKALDANDFNALLTTTQAIIRIADPRGQQAFDMLREKFKGQSNIIAYVDQLEAQFKKAIEK